MSELKSLKNRKLEQLVVLFAEVTLEYSGTF